MRLRNIAGLAVVLAATVLVAPSAQAAAPSIDAPSSLYPRSDFGVSVDCPDKDWRDITSDVLVAPIHLTPIDSSRPTVARGHGRVISTAKPGTTYTLRYGCGSQVAEHPVRIEQEPPASGVELRVEPQTGKPGTQVTLRGTCYKVYPPYPVESSVLEPVEWTRTSPSTLEATTRVRDVKPGTYKVTFYCAGSPATVNFTVPGAPGPAPGPGPGPNPPGTRPAPAPSLPPGQVTHIPRGAPETGA